MVVIILERVPPSLRGELSRWLVEPKPGIFIGHVSALVRDKLWEKCCRSAKAGGVLQAWSTNNEQRYAIRTYGRTKRQVMEFDGVQLMAVPHQLPSTEVSTEEQG
jgi:CRISPR-associated protein Cas2